MTRASACRAPSSRSDVEHHSTRSLLDRKRAEAVLVGRRAVRGLGAVFRHKLERGWRTYSPIGDHAEPSFSLRHLTVHIGTASAERERARGAVRRDARRGQRRASRAYSHEWFGVVLLGGPRLQTSELFLLGSITRRGSPSAPGVSLRLACVLARPQAFRHPARSLDRERLGASKVRTASLSPTSLPRSEMLDEVVSCHGRRGDLLPRGRSRARATSARAIHTG